MDRKTALMTFSGNWFLRDTPLPALTHIEEDVIALALSPAPASFHGQANTEAADRVAARLEAKLAEHPNALDRIGVSLLKVAMTKRGCGGAVSCLLARGVPLDLDDTVYNVLHEAGHSGAADTLRAAFEAGAADPTAVSVKKPHTGWPDNLSLLYWAAWGGYPELAKVLIEYGAGVHHDLPIKGNGERGVTSLHEAIAPGPWKDDKRIAGKREVARLLIEDGASYDAWAAAGLDDDERLQTLLDADSAVVNAKDPFGVTPLHWAARAGALNCLRLLLEAGADANATNKSKRTPLHFAAETDNPHQAAAIDLLVRHGALLDAQDRKGRTPLHRATYEGCLAAVEALLAAGADRTIPNKTGKTAFAIARKAAKHLRAQA